MVGVFVGGNSVGVFVGVIVGGTGDGVMVTVAVGVSDDKNVRISVGI